MSGYLGDRCCKGFQLQAVLALRTAVVETWYGYDRALKLTMIDGVW